MKTQLFLFDFDGTIADTLHALIKISNQLAEEFGFETIEPHEVDDLKDKTSKEVIGALKVPIMKIPILVAKAKKELNNHMALVEPVEGLKEILIQLKELGHEIGILTSNSAENVIKFLKRNDLDIFDFISSTSKIWSKNTSLNQIIKKSGLDPAQILYIGDETRDIIAAQKAGIQIAAVTWGYNSRKTLQSHNPDYLLSKPEELVGLSFKA